MRVPTSILECFKILDAVVDDVSIDMIRNKREGELVDCHWDLGMFIRNNWLYDQTSPFVQYLRSQGLSWMHEDSVSAFLIKLYWEYLNLILMQPLLGAIRLIHHLAIVPKSSEF